jgi:hypothetical protein
MPGTERRTHAGARIRIQDSCCLVNCLEASYCLVPTGFVQHGAGSVDRSHRMTVRRRQRGVAFVVKDFSLLHCARVETQCWEVWIKFRKPVGYPGQPACCTMFPCCSLQQLGNGKRRSCLYRTGWPGIALINSHGSASCSPLPEVCSQTPSLPARQNVDVAVLELVHGSIKSSRTCSSIT